MSQEYLFSKHDIFGVIEGQKTGVKKRIQEIPSNTILHASEHDLVQALIEEFRLDVTVIKEEEIGIEHWGETQVDVIGDPMRMIDRPGPFYVAGTEAIIAVPFKGERNSSGFGADVGSSPPPAEIRSDKLLLRDVRTDHDAEEVKREYQQAVKFIKESLGWLSQSARQFNDQLAGQGASQVRARKGKLLADANMAAIGLPMKKRDGAPLTYAAPVKRRVPKIGPGARSSTG
jgi:hypothetical protein